MQISLIPKSMYFLNIPPPPSEPGWEEAQTSLSRKSEQVTSQEQGKKDS